MNSFNNENYSNGYVNIPVTLFQTYYSGGKRSLVKFIENVIAWGVATGQLAYFNIRYDQINIQHDGIGVGYLSEWLDSEPIKPSKVQDLISKYEYTDTDGGTASVGVTFSALSNMLNAQFRNSREEMRVGDCWMIYFALKSIAGKKKSTLGQWTWDNILNRALGSTQLTLNRCEKTKTIDWTAQYRCGKSVQSRKKMDVIKRLVDHWGVTYSPKDPITGKNRPIPIFSMK